MDITVDVDIYPSIDKPDRARGPIVKAKYNDEIRIENISIDKQSPNRGIIENKLAKIVRNKAYNVLNGEANQIEINKENGLHESTHLERLQDEIGKIESIDVQKQTSTTNNKNTINITDDNISNNNFGDTSTEENEEDKETTGLVF